MYTREKNSTEVMEFEQIAVGQEFKLSHTITKQDVDTFAALTGDFNPLHVDEEFAKQTSFRKPVAHGMLSASFISTMIGMLIPGPGALWSSQTLEFLQPVYVGDCISVIASVIQKSESIRSIKIKVRVVNQHGHEVITGQSLVKLLKIDKENKVTESIKQKTVLITGGSRGIGAAVARRLAEENYGVVLVYRQSKTEADALVSDILGMGKRAMALKADVSDEGQLAQAIQEAHSQFGPISGLVHCAAPLPVPHGFEDQTWPEYENQINTQIKGAYQAVKLLYPDMLETKSGSIIFIGSIFAEGTPPIQQSPYVVAKAGLAAFARTLAVELGPKNIRVNIVSPGMTETDMIASLPEKTKMLAKMQTPLRKLAKVNDVAATVLFLMSSGAEHITGENIRVCGGLSMG